MDRSCKLPATTLIAMLWSFSEPSQARSQVEASNADKANAGEEAPVVLAFPAVTGPLTTNSKPTSIDAGPFSDIYVTSVVSALGMRQDHAFPGDKQSRLDLSNGHLFVQKVDGPIQFVVQAGVYAFPSLGAATFSANKTTKETFGVIPQAFLKLVPNDNFNLMIGKLPTLAGAEYTFSFQNMNVNRGLLWNQENAVNRGVQANFAKGPLSFSASLNDGFYSNKFNWLSGLASYAASPTDTISVVAMGNVGTTRKTSFATPLLQNNSQIYNLVWTHSSGRMVITPYLQLTHVQRSRRLGIDHSASTFGAALLARYALSLGLSIAGRGEYITSSGSPSRGTPNLLYGTGSDAWSLTITPTYQRRRLFVRSEVSFVRAQNVVAGSGLGSAFNNHSQTRATMESGILF